MTGAPDEDFAKIFELLNAFEQLDDVEQRAFLKSEERLVSPLEADVIVSDEPEPKFQNNLVNTIMAAMANVPVKPLTITPLTGRFGARQPPTGLIFATDGAPIHSSLKLIL